MKTPDKVRGTEDEQNYQNGPWISYGSTDNTEMSSDPWNATGVPAGTMDTLSIPPSSLPRGI